MVAKKVGVIIGLVFLIILSSGLISADACSVKTYCSSANTVMKLSGTTNAHGSFYNQGSFDKYLCCDFTGTHTCSGSNKILQLSSNVNAHAEIPGLSNYRVVNVCFGDLECASRANSCPSGYNIPMLSLSQDTNAHLGSFNTYPTKICCKHTSSSSEDCKLTSASWSRSSVVEGTSVALNIQGTDCNGKTISFIVREDDAWPLSDTPVQANPVNVVFNGNSATGTWIAEWQNDILGDPEYYFIASVVGDAEEITSRNPLLTVTQPAQTCSQLGGTCKTSSCSGYDNCNSLGGTCTSGYCCSGTCTAKVVPKTCSQLGGTCKTSSCSGYDNCNSLSGTCTSGYCCSGTCTAKVVLDSKIISSCEELQKIGSDLDYPLDGNYILANDIDCSATSGWNSGKGFDPIGDMSNKFTGKFDGNNYKIRNLYINRDRSYVSLFGVIADGAEIKNVGMMNVDISGQIGVGGLAGQIHGSTITNSYATGSVKVGNPSSGGGMGGGLVGAVHENSVITKSYATSSVNCGSHGFAGGLVGTLYDSTIINSYAKGSVSGVSFVGGLVGTGSGSTITNSYSTGSVSGGIAFMGGLVGSTSYPTVAGSYWDKTTSGRNNLCGPMAGACDDSYGRITADMMQQATFVGWDFVSIWDINEGTTYPYHRAEESVAQTCSQLGGTCKTSSCSSYDNCNSLGGTCTSGYCCSGTCTAKATPTKAYWADMNGNEITEADLGDTVQLILTGVSPGDCIPRDYKDCYDNDVYWFDSCGVREEKKEECGEGCLNGECVVEDGCVDTSWSPSIATVCEGESFTQTSNCGNTRVDSGTKDCVVSCVDTSWSPSTTTVCSGDSFTQTSNCGNTRSATGTRYCPVACVDSSWSPATSTVCSGTSFTQTSNCGNTRSATGTKYCAPVCTDTSWTPSTTTVCSGDSFTQSRCDDTRNAVGTMNCVTDECFSDSDCGTFTYTGEYCCSSDNRVNLPYTYAEATKYTCTQSTSGNYCTSKTSCTYVSHIGC